MHQVGNGLLLRTRLTAPAALAAMLAEALAVGQVNTGESSVHQEFLLGGNVPHIGIVVDQKSAASGRYLIVHNIGQGPRMEDVLFNWKITGHYRYFGPGR